MCHVLIIEDEPLIAMNILLLLAEHGATSAVIADTQDDAVRSAIERRPAFITADVNLAAGRGPDAVRIMIERLGEVPVLFITATPEACVDCVPAAWVMRKPMDEAIVVTAFRELVADALRR